MKIIKTKKHKKILIICTVLTITLVAGGAIYYFGFHQKNQEVAEVDTKKTDNKKKISDKKSEEEISQNTDAEKTKNTNSDKPSEPEKIENSDKYKVSMTISVGKNRSGETLNVSAAVGAVATDGTCTYHFTHSSGAKIEKTATLLPSPTTTVCSSVDLTTGEFSTGTWSVYVDFSNNTYKGKSDDQNFSI